MRYLAPLNTKSLLSPPVSPIVHFMLFIHTGMRDTCANVTGRWNDVASLLPSPASLLPCQQLQKASDLPVLEPTLCSCRLQRWQLQHPQSVPASPAVTEGDVSRGRRQVWGWWLMVLLWEAAEPAGLTCIPLIILSQTVMVTSTRCICSKILCHR